MTYPIPDPPQIPPTGPRYCQYCAKPAEVFDIDGAWCSPECQRYDRQAEITVWRKALEVTR